MTLWKLAGWMCGGFKAERADGELVYIYKKFDWSPNQYMRAYSGYEFRWRGRSAGRLTTDGSWLKSARLVYTLDDPAVINEQDLLEITGLLSAALN